jgi:hypothetical protein
VDASAETTFYKRYGGVFLLNISTVILYHTVRIFFGAGRQTSQRLSKNVFAFPDFVHDDVIVGQTFDQSVKMGGAMRQPANDVI